MSKLQILKWGDTMENIQKINCITEAIKELNNYLERGEKIGGDFLGFCSGNINKIWAEGNLFKFSSSDGAREEYEFLFDEMQKIKINDKENGIIFILKSKEQPIKEDEKLLVEEYEDRTIINEFYINDIKCKTKEDVRKLHNSIDCGEVSWDEVFDRYRIINSGVIGILNIQPLQFQLSEVLYKLSRGNKKSL